MSLKVTCPITGYRYKLPGFTGKVQQFSVSAPHPLLECTLQELNHIPMTGEQEDNVFLFIAYLWQLNQQTESPLVLWNSPIDVSLFSRHWLLQQFPRLKQLTNWVAVNSNNAVSFELPGIRITPKLTLESIQFWLDRCYSIKESMGTFSPMDAQATLLAKANKEREMDAQELINQETGGAKLRRNKIRKDYITDSLYGQAKEYLQLVLKVVFRPADFEIYVIRRVKAYCLDFLLETTQEQLNEKDIIIRKLDQAIADKITVAEALGMDNEQEAEAREELESTYTIEHEGNSYMNSLINLPTRAHFTSVLQKTPPKFYNPESEPKREDFSSDLKFEIAHKIWKRKQDQGVK